MTGPRCDGYALGREIGFGRIARAYAARDLASGARCAVKVLSRADPLALRAEATAARLLGPDCSGAGWQVVTIRDVVLAKEGGQERPALVMSLVQGQALGDWLADSPPLARRLHILRGMLHALGAVHAARLAHNDLGMGNFLVSCYEVSGREVHDQSVTLLDFDRASGAGLPDQPRDWGPGGFYDGGPGVACCGPAHDLRAIAILAAMMLGGRHPFAKDPRPLLGHAWRGGNPYRHAPQWFEFTGFCTAVQAEAWLAPALRMQAGVSAQSLLQTMPDPHLPPP